MCNSMSLPEGRHQDALLWRDYETRSTLNLQDAGAWRYATHATTDLWCGAYAVDDDPVRLWIPGDPIPPEWIEAAQNPDWIVCAFADGFERLIEQHILGPRYGWPLAPVERHRCLQATALSLALPASLKGAADALGLEQQKDVEGRRVMMQMARPRKPRKGEDPAGIYWFDDAERLEKLYSYCKQDAATERALHRRIGTLSPEEQALWLLDATINDRGLFIDGELLDGAIKIAEAAQLDINTELQMITEGAIETLHQTVKLIAWLAAQGCVVTDIQKGTVKKALTRKNLAPAARRVLELRLDGAHAATAKLLTMRDWRNGDGRARGVFRFHGASTGRWTSFGIQLHNLKRPLTEDLGVAIEAVASGDLARVRQLNPQPMSVVGDIARGLICAAPEHRLIAADFSGVESRVTAWVSGQQSKLDQWTKFDRTQNPEDEPYFILGTRTFGLRPEIAREPGKVGDLAFGYMGGPGAWEKLAPPGDTSSEEEIRKRQRAWRLAHPSTVRFWKAIDRAAILAVQNPGKTVNCSKRVSFRYDDATFLRMTLPSGRQIAYPFPRVITTSRGNLAVIFKDNAGGKWVDCRHGLGAYGGTWIENAVQAIARDVFASAMQRLEAAGYHIILHVHDEIVAEVPDDFGSADKFLKILTTAPAWADGLPIAAKVRNGHRFCKIAPAPEHATPAVSVLGVAEVPGEASERTGDRPIGSIPEDRPANDEDDPDAEPAAEDDEEPPFDVEEESTPPPEEDKPASGNGHDYSESAHGRHSSDGNVHGDNGPKHGRRTAQWIYPHPDQPNYLRVDRCDLPNGERKFYQHHWNGVRWIHGVKGTYAERKIPYRLPDLKAALLANPDVELQICEGESDADAMAQLGFVATTNPGGALSWTPDLTSWLRVLGVRRAVIHEDNDDAARDYKGQKRSALLTAELSSFIKLKIVRYPDVPEGEDVRWWIEHGHTKEELEARIAAAEAAQASKLHYVDMSAWDSIAAPVRPWAVFDLIPLRQVYLFTGHGAVGKSLVELARAVAHVLGKPWLGMPVTPGAAIYLSAEDDKDELHRRLADILRHYDAAFAEVVAAGLHLLDYADENCILGSPDRAGVICPTPLFQTLERDVLAKTPVAVMVDTVADVFAGNENDRSQVTQFLKLMQSLAQRGNCSLSVLAHPSLTGMSSGSGISGSTGWHNKVRARAYMHSVETEKGEEPDPDLRQIEFMKNNYGRINDTIQVRWEQGVYIREGAVTTAEKLARAQMVDELFLKLLDRWAEQGRNVSDKKTANTYAPSCFAREPEAKIDRVGKQELTAAMERLFRAGKIHSAPYGIPSKGWSRLERK